jgi:hypothetical protein
MSLRLERLALCAGLALVCLSIASISFLFLVVGSDKCAALLSDDQSDFPNCPIAFNLLINVSVEQANVQGIRIPSIVYRSNFVRPRGVVILVIGGPGERILPFRGNEAASLPGILAARGYIVSIPAFSGTYHRSRYPRASLESAGAEIVASSAWAKQVYPDLKQCLVGVSLGGYIIAYAKGHSQNRRFQSTSKTFINPMVVAPEVRYNNIIDKEFYVMKNGQRSYHHIYEYKAIKTQSSNLRAIDGIYREQYVETLDIYKNFFGDYFRTPAFEIGKPFPELTLIYSSKDPDRAAENIPAYKAMGAGKLIPLSSSKHIISEDWNAWFLNATIVREIQSCVSR